MELLSIYIATNKITSQPQAPAAARHWAEPPAPQQEAVLGAGWTGQQLRCASLLPSAGCEVSENAVGVTVAWYLYLPVSLVLKDFLLLFQGPGFPIGEHCKVF